MENEDIKKGLAEYIKKATGKPWLLAKLINLEYLNNQVVIHCSSDYIQKQLLRSENEIKDFLKLVNLGEDFKCDIDTQLLTEQLDTKQEIYDQNQMSLFEKSNKDFEKFYEQKKKSLTIPDNLGMSPDDQKLTFDDIVDYDDHPFKVPLQTYTLKVLKGEWKKGIYIHGWKNGVGKSMSLKVLANAMLNDREFFQTNLSGNGQTIKFIHVDDLMMSFRDNLPNSEGGSINRYRELSKYYKNVPVLMIDDLGQAKVTHYFISCLKEILEARKDKITCFSSNYDLFELETYMKTMIKKKVDAEQLNFEYKNIETLISRIARNTKVLLIEGVSHDVSSEIE